MNITGYVTKNKSTFAESPFNEADSLVLSQLSYLSFGRKYAQYPKVALSELSAYGDDLVRGTFYPKSNVKLLHALAKSPRFAEVKVGFFRQRNSVKRVFRFAAVTFLLPNGDSYIAFRGTDTTLCGWKEDFYMSFLDKILIRLRKTISTTSQTSLADDSSRADTARAAIWRYMPPSTRLRA